MNVYKCWRSKMDKNIEDLISKYLYEVNPFVSSSRKLNELNPKMHIWSLKELLVKPMALFQVVGQVAVKL